MTVTRAKMTEVGHLIGQISGRFPNVPHQVVEDALWDKFHTLALNDGPLDVALLKTMLNREAISAWRSYNRELGHMASLVTIGRTPEDSSRFEIFHDLPAHDTATQAVENDMSLNYLFGKLDPEGQAMLSYYLGNGEVSDKEVSRSLYGQANTGQRFRRVKAQVTEKVRRIMFDGDD